MPKWNHNLHYHPLILDAIPPHARTALDIGTGDGLLALDLLQRVGSVTAIDIDADVLSRAAARSSKISWLHGDAMTYHLAHESFDVVASVAALHHFADLRSVLARMAELTAPGGVVAAIGIAKSHGPKDLIIDSVGAVRHRVYAKHRGYWEHTAAVADADYSYDEARRAVDEVLPGAAFNRRTLFRYSLIWRKR